MNIDTAVLAAEIRNIRAGCATDNGRDAVDAVAIALGNQFEHQDILGGFDRAAFLRDCGAA